VESVYSFYVTGRQCSSYYGFFDFANGDATFDIIRSVVCFHNVFGSTYDLLGGLDLELGFRVRKNYSLV